MLHILKENWKRSLDDCFIYWPYVLGNITDFLQILNSMHPKLQFTVNTSDALMPFLDILIYKRMAKYILISTTKTQMVTIMYPLTLVIHTTLGPTFLTTLPEEYVQSLVTKASKELDCRKWLISFDARATLLLSSWIVFQRPKA